MFDNLKDWIIRNMLFDHLSLPIKLRRKNDYLSSLKLGWEVYSWVRSHTRLSLSNSESILDIGCGDGRVAKAFYDNNKNLNYAGLDINGKRIKELNKKYSNTSYKFIEADIYHPYYNTNGSINAENYILPFENNSYELVILNSVFSHLKPDIIRNYMGNISRVLTPKGKCWSTFYILTDAGSKPRYNFQDSGEGFHAVDEQCPEKVIAYDKDTIIQMIEENGLAIEEIYLGTWRNPQLAHIDLNKHDQDVVVLINRK